MIKELIKVKEKSVMTKKEIILYTIKSYIGYSIFLVLMWLFINAMLRTGEYLIPDEVVYVMFGFITLTVIFIPGFKMYSRWNRWDKYFPKTLYINPKTRAEKLPEHYEESMDILAYLIAMDETYDDKLKLSKEDTEYLLYILDSYYSRKSLDSYNAPYEVETK